VKSCSNLLLAQLTESELQALRPHMESVVLKKGDILDRAPGPGHLYFVEAGVLCVLANLSERENVTVALTGREGVGHAVAILGPPVVDHRLRVLIPGSAYRIEADLLRGLRRRCPLIVDLTEGYVQALIAQIGQSAICNRYHLARRRLAGWLLLIGDCAETTRLPLTHQALTQIVGGARSLVTTSLTELRDLDAIDYKRGVVVLKRRPLVRNACECYGRLRPLFDHPPS
jgi:CRP-like cAMP-binding protein